MKRLALVAFVAVLLAACASSRGGAAFRGQNKKLVQATIYLWPAPTGATMPCVIHTVPQVVELERNREQIVWSIADFCGGTEKADVEVVFNPSSDPLDGCTADATNTPGRKGKKKIRCRQKVNPAAMPYKYEVRLDGAAAAEDPELEIVQ